MAAVEFRLPDIGEGVAEGEIVKWFVQEGDTVREDAPLVSVLTDKANVEIPSPRAGKISKLHAREGEKVKVGALLVTFETGGAPEAPAPAGAPAPSAPAPAPSGAGASAPAPAAARSPEGSDERPKASGPTPASPTADAPAGPAGPPSSPPGPAARILATPFVRRLAAERGVDLAAVKGSGPNGRITEQDIERASVPAAPAAPASPTSAPPAARPASAPASPSAAPSSARRAAPTEPDVERIPIRGVRRVIAEHMAESKHRAAHFTYVEEIDVTELVHVRDRMAHHLEKQGTKLTYLPFIIKAVVAGLRAHPHMNATMDDERNELVVHHRYQIGIAMAAPEGLIVPVVRDADTKSVAQLARELQEYSERGRAGKLTRGELTGSTFTITSLGALGGVLATPILNYPEVAILGVHKIARRPVYRPDGTIGPAELMNLSVSLDHRVIDGIVGAQFLSVVKGQLEDPHALFAELA
jgi:pyruvate dehydrogenase E2 component (dihydrolipoamide acetyltransferase)